MSDIPRRSAFTRQRVALADAMDREDAKRWGWELGIEERQLNFDYAGRVLEELTAKGWRIVKTESDKTHAPPPEQTEPRGGKESKS